MCAPKIADNYKQFVQVKAYDDKFYTYCPGSVHSVEGRPKEPCPKQVFVIPWASNFQINDDVHEGATWNLMKKCPRVYWEATASNLTLKPDNPETIEDIEAQGGNLSLETHKIVIMTVTIMCLFIINDCSYSFQVPGAETCLADYPDGS